MSRLFRTKRFINLPAATAAQGKAIEVTNEQRVGMILINQGAGNVYISDDPAPDNLFPMETGMSLNFLLSGTPTNTVYAWGDVGHDLRVLVVLGPATGVSE